MQQGLGLEHEFALEFGEVSTPECASWVSKLLGVPAKKTLGCRVILNVGSIFGHHDDLFRRTAHGYGIHEVKIAGADPVKPCLRPIPRGHTYFCFTSEGNAEELDVTELYSTTTVDPFGGSSDRHERSSRAQRAAVNRVVERNRALFESIARHEAITVVPMRWRAWMLCPVRPLPRSRRAAASSDQLAAIMWTLLSTLCEEPTDTDDETVEIEYTVAYVDGKTDPEHLPLLVEVKSERFMHQSPEQIMRQVRRAERNVVATVCSNMGSEFDEARRLFGDPRACYLGHDDRVIVLTVADPHKPTECRARVLDSVYLGSYHIWISPRHEWTPEPERVMRDILPRYIEDCRALAFVVQWAEPLLMAANERGSFRHTRDVSSMGTADLTRLKIEGASEEVPRLGCDQLTGRVDVHRKRSGMPSIVSVEPHRDPREDTGANGRFRQVSRNDVRTENMCEMLTLPLRVGVSVEEKTGSFTRDGNVVSLADAVDTKRWRSLRQKGLQGLEFRIFDNCSSTDISASLQYVFDTMTRICRDRPESLIRSSLQPSKRAEKDATWRAMCDVVRLGEKSEHWADRATLAARLARKIERFFGV